MDNLRTNGSGDDMRYDSLVGVAFLFFAGIAFCVGVLGFGIGYEHGRRDVWTVETLGSCGVFGAGK